MGIQGSDGSVQKAKRARAVKANPSELDKRIIRLEDELKASMTMSVLSMQTDLKTDVHIHMRKVNDEIRSREARLLGIAAIIEGIENRCMAVDGPVLPTTREITEDEIRTIYRLAKGEKECKPKRKRKGGRQHWRSRP